MSTTSFSIFIRKEAGKKKDAFRVNGVASIPEFLREAVTIDAKGWVHLDCVEGTEICKQGKVIGYEESSSTKSGWNCWVIGNADTNLIEIDGVFYKKATVLKAQKLGDIVPEFLAGADINRNDDGSWSIKTSWGVSSGKPGEAYWVLYGMQDGKPDANILTKSEKSYRDYILCMEDGTAIGRLCELDPE